jgi:hypothetical protein
MAFIVVNYWDKDKNTILAKIDLSKIEGFREDVEYQKILLVKEMVANPVKTSYGNTSWRATCSEGEGKEDKKYMVFHDGAIAALQNHLTLGTRCLCTIRNAKMVKGLESIRKVAEVPA